MRRPPTHPTDKRPRPRRDVTDVAGVRLERIVRRVVAIETALDPDQAARLVARLCHPRSGLMAAARIRRDGLASLTRDEHTKRQRAALSATVLADAEATPPAAGEQQVEPQVDPQVELRGDTAGARDSADAAGTGPAPLAPAKVAEPPAAEQSEAAAFDPYGFGLVPVFQREGSDGLMARLETVATTDDLRKMARAQQIALPAEIRRGDLPADAVRSAIVAAVEKRIADRRAAAS